MRCKNHSDISYSHGPRNRECQSKIHLRQWKDIRLNTKPVWYNIFFTSSCSDHFWLRNYQVQTNIANAIYTQIRPKPEVPVSGNVSAWWCHKDNLLRGSCLNSFKKVNEKNYEHFVLSSSIHLLTYTPNELLDYCIFRYVSLWILIGYNFQEMCYSSLFFSTRMSRFTLLVINTVVIGFKSRTILSVIVHQLTDYFVWLT